ncbi:MAG: DUF4347 domain-containing protein [Lentisphaeria bacterium]|nr:DUF4347 domain-containing protein [Lentisphaeria bacterium]
MKNYILKFLEFFSGNYNLFIDSFAHYNRHTRRKATRSLIRLGLAPDNLRIVAKIRPLVLNENNDLVRRSGTCIQKKSSKKQETVFQKIRHTFSRKNKPARGKEAIWNGLESLEHRILLSASNGTEALDDSAPVVSFDYSVAGTEVSASSTFLNEMDALKIAPSFVVIIDSSVQDADSIISQLPDNAAVYILNDSDDGILQITAILENYTDLDSLQIFSHSNADEITLAGTSLNCANYH